MSRAEATDVANAVLDGTDGVLLGAETLRGKYPAITVKTVLAICRQAEEVFDYSGHFEWLTLQGEMVCTCCCFLYLTQCLQKCKEVGCSNIILGHCLCCTCPAVCMCTSSSVFEAQHAPFSSCLGLFIQTPDISLLGQSCEQIVSMFAGTSTSEGQAAVCAGR